MKDEFKIPLHAVRSVNKVTAEAVANACGVTKQTVYNWEERRNTIPADKLQTFAEICGVPVGKIFL